MTTLTQCPNFLQINSDLASELKTEMCPAAKELPKAKPIAIKCKIDLDDIFFLIHCRLDTIFCFEQ